jgi:hypothetical protein
MPKHFGPIHGEAVIHTTPSIKDKAFTVYTEDDIHTLATMRGISWNAMYKELKAEGRRIQLDEDE